MLTALAALALLGLSLLGAFGLRGVWQDHIAPPIAARLPPVMWNAIEIAVERVLRSSATVFIVFAVAITVWEVSGAVRAVMGALNAVYDIEEERPIWHRFGLSFALGLLSLAVALLVRFAPARHQPLRWVSAGSVATVGFWVLASLAFRFYVTSVVSFRSPTGALAAVLVLTGYLYTSSIVFLVGVELNRMLEADAASRGVGLMGRVRDAAGLGRRRAREESA
jgi:membrane protein